MSQKKLSEPVGGTRMQNTRPLCRSDKAIIYASDRLKATDTVDAPAQLPSSSASGQRLFLLLGTMPLASFTARKTCLCVEIAASERTYDEGPQQRGYHQIQQLPGMAAELQAAELQRHSLRVH